MAERTAPIPPDEAARLERLRELFILDSETEAAFDSIASMASLACDAPIALITLVDAERQWFKSVVGLSGIRETARDISMCAHTILDDSLMEVTDAAADPRFHDNPFVVGYPAIRFYAGAPLVLPGGERVGTICVIDRTPRSLTDAQLGTLRALSQVVVQTLLMRRDLITKSLSIRSEHERVLEARAAELKTLACEQQATLDTDLIGILKARNRQIVWTNAGARKLLGYDEQELIGRSTRVIYESDEAFGWIGTTAYPKLNKGEPASCEVTLLRKDGSPVRCDMRAMALPSSPGDILVMLVDITALKHAEELRVRAIALEAENRQLTESSRLKNLFLSNLSHELRTPLNAVIGYAHLLHRQGPAIDAARLARYSEQIGASGRTLLASIDDMLNFAKLESGKLDLVLAPASLAQLIGDTLELFSGEMASKKLHLQQSMDGDLDIVVVDALRLRQVLSQFMSNAVKFSHPGGDLTVSAVLDGPGHFRIDVKDTGPGIDASDVPRLFTSFQQLSEGPSKAAQGTGLGLALARRLAEAQGGAVGVDTSLGRGSVFWVRLPVSMSSGGSTAKG